MNKVDFCHMVEPMGTVYRVDFRKATLPACPKCGCWLRGVVWPVCPYCHNPLVVWVDKQTVVSIANTLKGGLGHDNQV